MDLEVKLSLVLVALSCWIPSAQACSHYYWVVPKPDPSPDCNPVNRILRVHCGGYVSWEPELPNYPEDILWYWSPDPVTPGTLVLPHAGWSIFHYTIVHETSGPYTGLYKIVHQLVMWPVGAGDLGYYWCQFNNPQDNSTQFLPSPKIWLDANPAGTPCPDHGTSEFMQVVPDLSLCAEVSSTISPSSTLLSLAPSSTPPETAPNGFCCGVALYAGMASSVATAATVFVLGGLIFVIARALKRNAARNLRTRVLVDRNPFAPRNSEEHNIGLARCKKCARTHQEKRARLIKTSKV